jgi:hypothetical protein
VENFEDFLKNEAQSFKMQPSEKVWKSIETAIAKPGKSFIWWYAAAALVLVSCGTLLYFNANPTNRTIASKKHIETQNVKQNATRQPFKKEGENVNPVVPLTSGINKPGVVPQILNEPTIMTNKVIDNGKESTTYASEKGVKISIDEFNANNKQQQETINESRNVEPVSLTEQKPIIYKYSHRDMLTLRTTKELSELIRVKEATPKRAYLNYLISGDVNISSPRNIAGYSNFIKPAGGFGLTFSARYNFGRCWAISAGIGVRQNSYRIGAVNITPETIYIATSSTDSFPQNVNYKLSNESQHKNVLKQIIMPLAFHYQMHVSNRNYVSINTGIDIAKVIDSRYLIKNTTSDRLFTNASLINSFNTYMTLGVSYTHSLNDNLKLVCGYKMQYQMGNTFNNSYHLKESLIVNGLNFGIEF